MTEYLNQVWTGLTQLSQLYTTIHTLDKAEGDPLFNLKKALDTLKDNIDKSLPIVLSYARQTLITLHAILDLSDAEQERILGNPRNLAAVTNPLKELSNFLQNFVDPTLRHPQPSISEIEVRIPAAHQALNRQIEQQRGLLARITSAVSTFLTREVEYVAQKWAGNGDIPKTLSLRHHPLHELRYLIGCYMNNAQYALIDDREDQLKHTLEHLGFYSRMFGQMEILLEDDSVKTCMNIKDYIFHYLGNIQLSKTKRTLNQLSQYVTAYLRRRIADFSLPRDEDFYLLLYESGCKSRHLKVQEISVKEDQILWAQQHLDQDAMNQDEDIIWEAFIQYDELQLMNRYFQTILQHRVCHEVKDLADNVDRVLLYFQHIPPSNIKADVLKHLAETLISWVAFSKGWIQMHASGNYAVSLEQLQHVNEAIIQQRYTDAIRLLKHEIEHGPMSHALSAHGGITSPLKALQNLHTKFEDSLRARKVASETNFEGELEEARIDLSEAMSFYATFNIVLRQICRIPYSQSQKIYTRIIAEVQKNPQAKTRTFFSCLADEINQLTEVSLIFKLMAKLLMFPIYAPIRLFANHTTRSGLHFIKHYIQLPSKEPLGKIHISPFEKLTRCFQANIGAMKAWAADETCEKFGATTRDEALTKILKNPKMNNNFEREELVMKSGLLSVDLCVNISHINEFPLQLLRNITYNVTIPFFPLKEDHFLNRLAYLFKSTFVLVPQIGVEIFYYLCKILDFFINSLIQWGAKRILVTYNLPNRLFKSLSNSLYNSQYIPVFDEIILKQFQLIEKVIDEESTGSMQAEKESNTTRETIKEMIENLFEMVEMRHNLTKSKMLNPLKDDLPFIDEHTREIIRGLLDDNLSETLVNLLITLIQSLFNEDRMNDFLLNFIRAISATMTSQESILTEQDKRELEITHGYLTNQVIKDGIKNKCYKQELAINETLQRIIQKSVHRVVQTTSEIATSQGAALEYLIWMERTFYGAERSNFVSSMQQKIEAFKKQSVNRESLLLEMQRDFRSFMRELEQKQTALDKEPIAQTRRLQRFAIKVLLPNLQKLSTALRDLMIDHQAHIGCENALAEFNQALLSQKIYFRSIQVTEFEKNRQASHWITGKMNTAARNFFENATPIIIVKIEDALTRKLNNFATGVLALPKNSSFSESLICTALLNPFLEANSVTPDLRFSEE